jgi:hypothetical protein
MREHFEEALTIDRVREDRLSRVASGDDVVDAVVDLDARKA